MELSQEAEKVLLRIYIGQNIRSEGILQSEILNQTEAQELLSEGLIKENHFYKFSQFLTSEKGSLLASGIVKRKIQESKAKEKIAMVPEKALGFFNKRFVSKQLSFRTEKEYFNVFLNPDSWENSILANDRVLFLWKHYFDTLISLELCIKTLGYVATRGGETRGYYYVISPEVQSFLVCELATVDFTPAEESTLRLYTFLRSAKRILQINDVEQVRQRFYDLLKSSELTEDQVAAIVNEMSRQKMTSEYRGLLSELKPFDIANPTSYEIFLSTTIIDPAVKILLEGTGRIREFRTERRMPTLLEVKSESGILDNVEIGEFYMLVSDIERQIREFLKERLGVGWKARIENELPNVYKNWIDKMDKDNKWGIEPEKELINYSDLGDYLSIVKQYSRLFSDSDEDLGDILTCLKMWYNYGRNPLMHSRTVNRQRFFTTKSAVDFLSVWIRRKSSS
jgi:hypothetical protein